jgi:hypothetical protein
MKEFMLLIRNEIDNQSGWSSEQHESFLRSCEAYIEDLKKKGQLKAAQPLTREGVLLSGSPDKWIEAPFNQTKEVQVDYYHILAKDIREAIEIAKGNPELSFSSTAKIEVRPIKAKEESTEFVYPTNGA